MTLPDDHEDEQKRETQKEPQVAKKCPVCGDEMPDPYEGCLVCGWRPK